MQVHYINFPKQTLTHTHIVLLSDSRPYQYKIQIESEWHVDWKTIYFIDVSFCHSGGAQCSIHIIINK